MIKIKVTDPATGRSVEWKAMSRDSAIKQAKIETKAGAKVEVTEDGRTIWPK